MSSSDIVQILDPQPDFSYPPLQYLQEQAKAADAVRCLAAAQRAHEDLQSRSLFRRFIGKFTGANNRTRDITIGFINETLKAHEGILQDICANQRLLGDGLYFTQCALVELAREYNQFAERIIPVLKETADRIVAVEQRVAILEQNANLLIWAAGLPNERPLERPCLGRIVWIIAGALESKLYWTRPDRNVLMTALKQTCQLPASLPTEEFLSRALEMSDDELERMQEDLKRFQIDKPFHLFSGATWPAVLLWELLNNRRAFSSASDVRERLRNVHYFDLADSVDLEEFAISLLIGLKPLLNSERVGELMLDLTDDSLIAFKDTLPPGSVLLNDRERLKAHAPSYDPNWCKAAWGYQADLIKTAKASVSLHQQYLEFPDKSTAWRVFLEFSGAYKTAQQGIVERAANENIGELGYLDDGVFEISKEITPNWVEWDKQRSNLAQQARRAYDFVASLPIPPRSQL